MTALVLAALLLQAEPAREPAPVATPAPSETPGAAAAGPAAATAPEDASEYRVGAGDVLEVTVFGNEDLSRTATVQVSGAIALPLLGDVPVAGSSVAQIQSRLAELLEKDYLVRPQVEVKVREYLSQYVMVVGEVNAPGRKPLRGRTRLIDVLVEAGGFTPRASGEVLITRSQGEFEAGQSTLRLQLGAAGLTPLARVNLEVPLRNGDIVTASPKFYVTVEGEVAKPGRYLIEGELTVTGAVATAGGLTRFGSSGLKVSRADPATGARQILEVDLKAVRAGRQPDLVLQPNDVVSVSRKFF